jgi:type IV pilus assembly protein PilM
VPAIVWGLLLISLGSLFSRQPEPLLGLDVSSSSVKLVELSKNKAGVYVLDRCAIEPLERGWITDGNIEKFDEVSEAVRRVVKKSGTKAKSVAMALPPSAVITKKIVLPGGLSEVELEMQVEAEANQYIPFPLEEVSLDFCVIGPSAASSGDIDVLIAASRREKVQDIQGLAESAGLKPVIVDVESYASRLAAKRLIEELPEQGVGSIVALFEVGALTTSMQVIRDDEVLYERDQAFGGAQLTQLIVRQYGFSLEEAESKKRSGELPEDYESTVLQPFIETMVQELGRALQFFFTSTPYHKVDNILLAGGAAALQGLTDAVTQQLNFPCSLVNPFDGMDIGDGVRLKKMTREAPSYLTACGLAMRRFLS